jgi:thiol-disulfide isomerase/thioredoxin
MTRSVISWMCLVIAMVVVGCTKSPTSPPKAPPATDSGPKESVAADAAKGPQETVPAAPVKETPAAETVKEGPAADAAKDSSTADTTAEPAKSDMSPPADVPPPKLPFEDIVAALGNEQANQAYRQIEQQFAQNPEDIMTRVRRLWLLNSVGSALCAANNQEKGLEAFRAALEQAQSVMANPQQPLPEEVTQALSAVFYNGACAQSLDGKPEDAKATLVKAIELGFSDLNNLRNDADLAAVRALPDFDQQLATWEALIAEKQVKKAQEVLAAGESFPFDFSLTDFSGQAINLTGFQGKVLIVDIWGTWCPPCRAEIPSFVKLQAEYGPQGLQIVGLNYENAENEAAAKELVTKFIQENGMNYPCAMGTPAIQQQVPNFEGYPTTLFIDRTGKVRAKVVGSHEYAFLEAIVKILLAEAAPPPAAPTDTPPAAPTDAPPADTGKAPTDTPPAGEGTPPTDAPPSGGGTPPTDAPAEPGK